jgi:flagellin
MVINHNISALNTLNKLNQNTAAAQSSLQKLSSGLKINSAADDAAGLSISEKMKAQVSGLNTASSNAQDGVSLLQTGEGALNETTSILQRMRELTVQAANDTNQDTDRDAIKSELTQLSGEVDAIGTDTQFNGKTLLDGSLNTSISNVGSGLTAAAGIQSVTSNGAAVASDYTLAYDASAKTMTLSSASLNKSTTISNVQAPAAGTTQDIEFKDLGVTVKVNDNLTADVDSNNTFHNDAAGSLTLMVGANQGQDMTISVGDMRAASLGVANASLDVSSNTAAETTTSTIDSAIAKVSSQRSTLGAFENRLTHTINNLSTQSENLTSAQSQITDVDMASEMSNYTRSNILVQSATAMLAHANQLPQGVLSLLQG